MKYISIPIMAFLIWGCHLKTPKPTQRLTIIGTVHHPTKSINATVVYEAMQKAQPEVILLERDSSAFDSNFKPLFDDHQNETIAIARYLTNYPNTLIRPIEFEGRDTYRDRTGLYPQANEVYQKLNELSRTKSFTTQEQHVWNRFAHFWVKLDSLAAIDLKAVNTVDSDVIVDSAKQYQYTKMKELIANRQEFNNMMVDAKGDSISYKAYFNAWEKFEHYDRNDAMVANIIRTIHSLDNQDFVLIVGYHHRYYIKKALERKMPELDITEFYE